MESIPNSATAIEKESDEALMLRSRDHDDRTAFETLARRYQDELYHYLRHYLGKADLADDVLQAALIKLYRNRRQYHVGRRVRPWLYAIATNEAIDLLRQTGRLHVASLDLPMGDDEPLGSIVDAKTPTPLDVAESSESYDWTHQAVAGLPAHLRSVVLLIYFQGLRHDEVAKILNIPVGTVKSRLHQALVKLGAAWNKNHPANRQD